MSFELRKLEDVCDILDHMRIPITSRDRKEGPYPYYGANGIQDYIDDFIFDDELVLLAEDGGNFGSKEKPIAYRISGKTWVNNHAHVLKPKNIIDIDYLCYSLMYYDVSGLVNGATRQKLTQSEMRKINIRYRSLEKQRQMVFKIKLISNIISSREHQLSNLNLLVKSRFVEMFGSMYEPKYKLRTLNDVCEYIKDGTHQTPTYTDDKIHGYKFLSSKDVTSGKIDWSKIKYIPKELHDELYAKIAPRRGDILLAKNGTTGVAALVECNEVFDIYVSLAILRLKEHNNPKYILEAINSQGTKEQFNKSLKGIGVPNLHLGEIKKAKIIIPPIELQNQFADFVAQVDKSKFVVTAKFQ